MCPNPGARPGTAPVRIDKAPGIWLLRTAQPRPGNVVARYRRSAAPSPQRRRRCRQARLVELFGRCSRCARRRDVNAAAATASLRVSVAIGGGRQARSCARCQFLLQPPDARPISASSSAMVSAAMTVSRVVADLAELGAQPLDARVEVAREIDQMALLAVLAGHAELPAVDGDADLGHSIRLSLRLHSPTGRVTSSVLVPEHAADRFDRLIDPLRDLAVGGSPVRARARVA